MNINIHIWPYMVMLLAIPTLYITYTLARNKTDRIWSVMGLSLFFCLLFFPAAWIYAVLWSFRTMRIDDKLESSKA